MWELKNSKVNLPKGFKLMEDVEFLYLYYGSTLVATFSCAGVKTEEVEKTAKEFKEKEFKK